jgi:dipeptidyl aminopeptidase/acylaminoacyl peptidase
VGDLSSRDQAAAVRALARDRPYVDPERVAIWGWSGGGSNTLNAMFRFPDVYKVGVSVAPVPDQTLYDTRNATWRYPRTTRRAISSAPPSNVGTIASSDVSCRQIMIIYVQLRY